MRALENLLRRWGFVKLERYGLVLTPEDRILATRPTILDDGIGGRIVGWAAEDLAESELQPWSPDAVHQRRELLVIAPRVPMPEPPPPEDDEWEWEIAVARARAAAAEPTPPPRQFPRATATQLPSIRTRSS